METPTTQETAAVSWHGHTFRMWRPADRQGFVCYECGHVVTLCDERAGMDAAKRIDNGTTALRDDDITVLSAEDWRNQSPVCPYSKKSPRNKPI
jgi:hypothetical protein